MCGWRRRACVRAPDNAAACPRGSGRVVVLCDDCLIAAKERRNQLNKFAAGVAKAEKVK